MEIKEIKNVQYFSQCELGIWKFVVQLKKMGSNTFIHDLVKDWVIKLSFQELISFEGCYHNFDYCQICAFASIVCFKKLFILSFESITMCMNIQIFSNSPSPSSINDCFPHAFSLPLITRVAQAKVQTPTYGIYVNAQLCLKGSSRIWLLWTHLFENPFRILTLCSKFPPSHTWFFTKDVQCVILYAICYYFSLNVIMVKIVKLFNKMQCK